MKRIILIILAIVLCNQFVSAQTASTVLRNGIPVEKGHRIFLKYAINKKGERVLKADAAENVNKADFTTLEDSSIYLVRKNAINVYLFPLNPLNLSYNTETKVIIDPINEAAANAFGELVGVLDQVAPIVTETTSRAQDSTPSENQECYCFDRLKNLIDTIQSKLEINKKDEIVELFNCLKGISFVNEQTVKYGLASVESKMKIIEEHFEKISASIIETKKEVEKYSCKCPNHYPDAFTAKFVFNAILKDFSMTLEEQKKRLTKLQTAYKLVKEMQVRASIGGETTELEWCIPLDEVPAKEGKISIYKFTVKESGYTLSDNKEIVSLESKELLEKIIKVRRFQTFIPEVSIGTAYTFLDYNTYGTSTDSLGQQTVGSPTKNSLRNLNITTMINFNYYIPNSPVHPLYQIGLGINSEIPSVLMGFGLRSNINGIRRMTISGGLAMNWLRELQTLEEGDIISGTGDIDKDFKYSAAPTLKWYVGIQYNF